MPYPAQIDLETLIETARRMIEEHGFDKLSLRMIAQELGVKAPSLYRHVENKAALLAAVNQVTRTELFAVMHRAMEADIPLEERLLAIANAYRAYAHANPATYELAFSTSIPELQTGETEAQNLEAVLRIQALFVEWIGSEAESLAALRGALALMHGWVRLEMAEQLRRGGDLNAQYEVAFRRYLRGWQASER
ncbi:MAG: helix-turn-helix transcriptional regulator [Anaerolineae bacterium]|nr:helix-turn-helix transcriptional regulator [Anaerolineae bacterium]